MCENLRLGSVCPLRFEPLKRALKKSKEIPKKQGEEDQSGRWFYFRSDAMPVTFPLRLAGRSFLGSWRGNTIRDKQGPQL